MSTRERLIAAARRCLLQHGHHGCSVKRIAAAAEANQGLVHHYFGSKEELLVTVLEREVETVRDAMPPPGSADFMGRFARPMLLAHPDRVALLGEFLALSRESPRIAEGLADVLRTMRSHVVQRLGVDGEVLAALLQSAMLGLGLVSRVDPTLPADAAAELLFSRLLPPAEPARQGQGDQPKADEVS